MGLLFTSETFIGLYLYYNRYDGITGDAYIRLNCHIRSCKFTGDAVCFPVSKVLRVRFDNSSTNVSPPQSYDMHVYF